MPASDRRKGLRIPVDLLANQYIDGEPYLCRVTDLSFEGLMLNRIGGPQRRQLDVLLEFKLPGEKRLTRLGALVAHQSGDRLGLDLKVSRVTAKHDIARFMRRAISHLPTT